MCLAYYCVICMCQTQQRSAVTAGPGWIVEYELWTVNCGLWIGTIGDWGLRIGLGLGPKRPGSARLSDHLVDLGGVHQGSQSPCAVSGVAGSQDYPIAPSRPCPGCH